MNWISPVAAHAPFLLVVIPLLGAVLTAIVARRGTTAARWTAIVPASLAVLIAGGMATRFSHEAAGPQMVSSFPWWEQPLHAATSEGALRFVLAFGVDGVSLVPLAIVALIGWLAVVLAERTNPPGKEIPYAGLLLGQGLSLSLFAAQEFVVWMLCCELWAWWAFWMIGRHGETDRRTAARTVLLTSRFAHVCWMLAGIGMAVGQAWIQAEVRHRSPGVSFLYADLVGVLPRWIVGNETALQLWTAFGWWVLLLWQAGLWFQWPLFPVHFGLRGFLAQARAPIAALGGATLILHGGYVLFRFVVPLLPAGGTGVMTLLSACAGFGVLYFGVLATVQTNWRSLGGYLALGVLHAAWLCGTSGRVAASLVGWQMICAAALLVAAMELLIGFRERHAVPAEFDQMTYPAIATPRWFGLTALCGGLLAMLPCVAAISGQAVLNLLELRRRGVPNLTLMLGSALSAWSVLRVLLPTGYGSANESSASPRLADLRRGDGLIGVPVLAAVGLMLAAGWWNARLGPTWAKLHDPFAVAVQTRPFSPVGKKVADRPDEGGMGRPHSHGKASGSSPPLPNPLPRNGGEGTRRTAFKPAESKTQTPTEFPWLSAPVFWGIAGVILLLLRRELLSPRWRSAIALIGWAGGCLAELFGGAAAAGPFAAWPRGCLASLGVIGLVELTAVRSSSSRTAASSGGLLLRLCAIAWAAVTNDLLFAGLAWELAEAGRWFRGNTARRSSREQLRHLISSGCYWLGLVLLAVSTRTTNITGLAAHWSATVPRNDSGVIVGVASQTGLAAAILLCSAVGIRCGLLPWSFGRRGEPSGAGRDAVSLDSWLDHLLGLTMFVSFAAALGEGFGGPLTVLLAISAAATAVWNGLAAAEEIKVAPLLRALMVGSFAALVLAAAGWAAKPVAWSTGIRVQLDQASGAALLAQGILAASAAFGALAALMSCREESPAPELYLEHYRGLFARRPWEAALLTGLLIGLSGRWLSAAFLPGWAGLTGLVLTPLPAVRDQIPPHPVLLAAAGVCLFAALPLLSRIAEWLRFLAFDPPVSSPTGSPRRGNLALAVVLAALLAVWTIDPALLARLIAG